MRSLARHALLVSIATSSIACARIVTPGDSDASDAPDACSENADAMRHIPDFTGPALSADWDTTAVGSPPDYVLDGGRIVITDASLADTPSAANTRSWIYDPSVDLGNQMTWSQPIGTGDVDLSFDFAWSSTVDQLTLVGIALTNANHQIEVFGGFTDPWNSQLGNPFARIRRDGGTADWSGDVARDGQGHMRFVRRAGLVAVWFDGHRILEAANGEDLRGVSIVAVRHRDPRGIYDFGTVAIWGLDVCY